MVSRFDDWFSLRLQNRVLANNSYRIKQKILKEAPIESMNDICKRPRPGLPANPVTINKAADISASMLIVTPSYNTVKKV